MTNSSQFNDDNEYLIIPNPIYDVVFRYLMSDPESATIVLSTLINEKIKTLHFESLTHSEKKDQSTGLQVKDPKTKDDIRLFHLDFTATIELPDGREELIMIEIQKASEPDDIFRFKRYISKNFKKHREVEFLDPETLSIKTIRQPIRLVPIFILNFRIENEINDLLIKMDRRKWGIFKNKPLQKHNNFIDNLSYDMLVIQLPNLRNIKEEEYQKDPYKSKLFALLKLFDQKSKVKSNEHRLRLIRKFFPGFLDRVIKRLQAASIDNPDLEEQMHAEDEYLRALIERDNKIVFFQQEVKKKEKELGERKKELGEKEKELGEKKKELGKKEKELGEKKKELGKKEKVIDEQKAIILNLAKMLKGSGISNEEIQQKTGLPLSEIEIL